MYYLFNILVNLKIWIINIDIFIFLYYNRIFCLKFEEIELYQEGCLHSNFIKFLHVFAKRRRRKSFCTTHLFGRIYNARIVPELQHTEDSCQYRVRQKERQPLQEKMASLSVVLARKLRFFEIKGVR